PDISTAVHLVLLALVPTLVSDLTLILAVKRVGPTTTAILGALEPLTAVFMGIMFLNESCTLMQVIGIVVVLMAVTLAIVGTQQMKMKNAGS
ncbi:MAG TPA: EamA family transporter, partial [Bacteroides sp.]|nr:EamA family transporter [Bacteroides sp.]